MRIVFSSVLSLLFLAQPILAQSSKFEVASTCSEIAAYVDAIAATTSKVPRDKRVFLEADLNKSATQYRQKIQLFRIVAGPIARKFAFEEMEGVYGIEKLARACVADGSCNSETLSVIVGFSFFLIDACKTDFEGS